MFSQKNCNIHYIFRISPVFGVKMNEKGHLSRLFR